MKIYLKNYAIATLDDGEIRYRHFIVYGKEERQYFGVSYDILEYIAKKLGREMLFDVSLRDLLHKVADGELSLSLSQKEIVIRDF